MLIKNQPWVESFSRSDMVTDIEWNMWRTRQSPFLQIEEGDEVVYACGLTPADSQFMWVVRVTHLIKAEYGSHQEAWELLKTGIPASIRKQIGITKAGFLNEPYTYDKPAQGWFLAFAGEPVRWLNRPRPDGFRFRPNGWGTLPDNSPALKAGKNR